MHKTREEVHGHVNARLTLAGLPAELTPTVLAAIDSAGYALTPKAGGPAVVVTEVLPVVKRRAGSGYLCEVDVDGVKVRWLEFESKDGGGITRLPA